MYTILNKRSVRIGSLTLKRKTTILFAGKRNLFAANGIMWYATVLDFSGTYIYMYNFVMIKYVHNL